MCPSGGLANFGTTVAKEAGHRGARRKPLKPLRAGTPGDSGVLVYSCAFYQCKAHTRLRVPRAPGVPHALFGRKIYQRLGRMARRERIRASGISVIASAAKQSIKPQRKNGLLRFARNDGRSSGLPRGDYQLARVGHTRPPRLSGPAVVNQGMTPPKNASVDIKALAKNLRTGGRAALARAITLIESRRSDHQAAARDLVQALLPDTGKAIRVGITGSPGVGQSTTIDRLALFLIAPHHHS